MKKLILFVFFMLFLSFSVQSQEKVTKKCKTCGKPIKECRYKGNHSQNNTSRRPHVHLDGNDLVCTIDGEQYRYRMVFVSGGTFSMGCSDEQMGQCFEDEEPVHTVNVGGFYMGQTEVTQALWMSVMGDNPSEFKGNNLPVENVSYDDCKEFISKLNSITGRNFRLPTEAEWEYAARGGRNTRGYRYSGSNTLDRVAWWDDDHTYPVAQKQGNELGLYDMSGNVWEWCNDWYGGYSSNVQTNPQGVSSGDERIMRGGGWCDDAYAWRVSSRASSKTTSVSNCIGFRLAKSIESDFEIPVAE